MKKLTKEEYMQQLLTMAESNCIQADLKQVKKPTDEFYKEIGKQVIDLLCNAENVMPGPGIVADSDLFQKEAKEHPVLYLSVKTFH